MQRIVHKRRPDYGRRGHCTVRQQAPVVRGLSSSGGDGICIVRRLPTGRQHRVATHDVHSGPVVFPPDKHGRGNILERGDIRRARRQRVHLSHPRIRGTTRVDLCADEPRRWRTGGEYLLAHGRSSVSGAVLTGFEYSWHDHHVVDCVGQRQCKPAWPRTGHVDVFPDRCGSGDILRRQHRIRRPAHLPEHVVLCRVLAERDGGAEWRSWRVPNFHACRNVLPGFVQRCLSTQSRGGEHHVLVWKPMCDRR